ncbi:hypothetical protein [Negativibacillus massiliensis]|uniref:hypothetical protein n=1 Tax=Negativibacillus massiliensis TaxID=1871035 RepID=UPI0039A024B2
MVTTRILGTSILCSADIYAPQKEKIKVLLNFFQKIAVSKGRAFGRLPQKAKHPQQKQYKNDRGCKAVSMLPHVSAWHTASVPTHSDAPRNAESNVFSLKHKTKTFVFVQRASVLTQASSAC